MFDAFLGPDLSRAHAVPRALVLGERARGRGRAAPPRAARRVVGARQRARPLRRAARPARRPHRARIPRSREVRLCGLMGGVELAPPADGLRWGRRVCAAAVDAGRAAPAARRRRRAHAAAHRHVGGAAPDRAHAHRRARRGHDVSAAARLERLGRRTRPSSIARRRPVAGAARRSIPSESRRRALGRRSRRTTTSASPSTPRCVAAAHDAIDRWGTGAGAGAPHRRLASGAPRARGRAGGVEGHRGRGALHHRVRRQPRRAHHLRRARHARVLRRAQPRVADRRSPARAARRSRCSATATPPTSTSCCAPASTPRAIVVTETVFSMDGDVAPVDKLLEVCAHHGALLVLDEAHAVLGPELDDAMPDDVDVLRVGTLSKTLGALGGFVAGPARYTDLLVNRARSYIFTTASTPGRHRRRARRAARRALARGRRAARPAARQRRPAAPRAPVADRPVRLRERGTARSRPRPRSLDAGFLVTAIRPPTVPPGTSRPAGRAVGRAHARAGRPARAAALRRAASRTAREPDPDRTRWCSSAGTATEVGKTWWTARGRAASCAPPASRSRRASRCSRATRRPRPTPRCSPPPPARTPTTVCPPHRTYRLAWAPPMAAAELGLARFTTADLAGGIEWPDGVDVGLVEGRRRPALADQRRRRQRRPRAPARARPRGARRRRRPRHHQRGAALGGARSTDFAGRRGAQPLRRRTRSTPRNLEHLVDGRRLRRGHRRRAQLADRLRLRS